MLLKKKFKQQEFNEVHMMNGMAELFGIKLNIRCFVVDDYTFDFPKKVSHHLFFRRRMGFITYYKFNYPRV